MDDESIINSSLINKKLYFILKKNEYWMNRNFLIKDNDNFVWKLICNHNYNVYDQNTNIYRDISIMNVCSKIKKFDYQDTKHCSNYTVLSHKFFSGPKRRNLERYSEINIINYVNKTIDILNRRNIQMYKIYDKYIIFYMSNKYISFGIVGIIYNWMLNNYIYVDSQKIGSHCLYANHYWYTCNSKNIEERYMIVYNILTGKKYTIKTKNNMTIKKSSSGNLIITKQ